MNADTINPSSVYTAHCDGASRGNPGPASYAVVISDPEGKPVTELSRAIGIQTNNYAEYSAVIAALDRALEMGIQHLRIISDSEVIVRQITGVYKVRSADLMPLHDAVRQRVTSLSTFDISHTRRSNNAKADRLANEALDHAAAASANTSPVISASIPATKPISEGMMIQGVARNGVVHPIGNVCLPDGTFVRIVLD